MSLIRCLNLAQAFAVHLIDPRLLMQKVWAHQLPYEKAEEILGRQFSEFPAATRQKALSDAKTDTR